MSFGNPYLLLTLLVIPVAILFYVLAERRRMRYAVAFTNLGVLAAVARRAPAWRRLLPFGVFLLAVAALCVAVARPHRTTSVAKDRATVILVVDVSGSMQARDVKPTRLGAAQAAVRTFLKRVPKNVRVGLIAFAGEADVAAPPTTDRQMVLDSVDALGGFSGFGGTAIGDALSAAVDLGKASLAGSLAASTNTPTKGLVSVLFLSDGAQNRGVLLPIQGAELARQAGIPVYTVALGTPNGSLPSGQFGAGPPGIFGGGGGGGRRLVPPDPATLRQIAEVTNGEFFNARSSKALQSAYKRLGSQLGRTRAKTEITYEFVGLAALLLMVAGGLSALWAPRLP
jgi:Ca-activated chloride channel family protein